MPKADKKAKKKMQRISFGFTEKSLARFDRVKDDAGCSTKAELVRRAIEAFSVISREQRNGAKVFVVRKSGDKLILSDV